ncbi:MAG TPA: DUF5916 domain-containing protein, partial [Cyclobacteriaceae bacterium]|nr:DUF5916 domain-containing protein [Cyclobacteriaceae bacterium]
MDQHAPLFLGGMFCLGMLSIPLISAGSAILQEDSIIEKKTYLTKKITDVPPLIDGILDDQAWGFVDWGDEFIQFQPDEGKAPAQKTAFKILYDDKNIYVGIKCYDTEPEKIVKRMGRRDNYDGDWVQVVFDSYFDHLTAFGFMVTASGVIGDEYITNDFQNEDLSWDPIWYVKTTIDHEGWNAEMRIPLSQLRFPEKEELVWGLEFLRRDHRKGELSMWQYIKKNAPGFVHRFGELHGLQGLKPQKQLEVMPYVLGKIENSEKVEGNPYATGSRQVINAGLDAKIGITSNFTLDLTFNPDFGQVEADPSIVNLTGFQNYFSERRPFFIESNNILDYRISESIAWGSHNSDNLFYSRRIGHNPQGYPGLNDNEYVRIPENTTILGALKLTGKTQDGLSVGVLESLTQREIAKISDGTNERSEAVEPLTNYFETRIIKDYNKGNTQIGGIVTSVNRDLRDPELDFLRRSAYAGGLDFNHNWKNKTWYLYGNVIFSRVEGSTESITNTQTSQEHLFQRPGSGRLNVDTTLSSLNGTGATIRFGRGGNGKIQFQLGGTYRSPGIELNDIGYLYKANALYQFFWASYHIYNPWWILNRFQCNINQWTDWDFGGNNLYRA